MSVVNALADIEDSLVSHWLRFGSWPQGQIHNHDGLLWFETPIKALPYNGVIRSHLPGDDRADAAIARVLERFRSRGVGCIWFVHPTAMPADLGARLAAHGLAATERITCMSLDLPRWFPQPLPGGVEFAEVTDDAGIDTYAELTFEYWGITDEDDRRLIAELQRYWGPTSAGGHRYLAFVDGRPAGKAYLSTAGPSEVAAIYGMNVRPEMRGRGIAAGLTTTLIDAARGLGCRRVVLHSTPMAVPLYRRTGFAEQAQFDIHASAALWRGND